MSKPEDDNDEDECETEIWGRVSSEGSVAESSDGIPDGFMGIADEPEMASPCVTLTNQLWCHWC